VVLEGQFCICNLFAAPLQLLTSYPAAAIATQSTILA